MFIPKTLILFGAVVIDTCFLIYFSCSSSLLYINSTYFFMLICILQLYYMHVVVLIILCVCSPLDVLHLRLCHLKYQYLKCQGGKSSQVK